MIRAIITKQLLFCWCPRLQEFSVWDFLFFFLSLLSGLAADRSHCGTEALSSSVAGVSWLPLYTWTTLYLDYACINYLNDTREWRGGGRRLLAGSLVVSFAHAEQALDPNILNTYLLAYLLFLQQVNGFQLADLKTPAEPKRTVIFLSSAHCLSIFGATQICLLAYLNRNRPLNRLMT